MSDQENEVQAQVAAETKVVGKKAKATSTNLIGTIAHDVEILDKNKALKLAETLATDIELNYFKLGGVLKVIMENSWFEGYESFDIYVYERFGFQARKARYLINIYTDLVTNMIPWEKVQSLGWTKLKDLAPILTLENLDEWIAKASALTVLELQAVLKGTGESEKKEKTTDDNHVLKFNVKGDQLETVQAALNKGKAEMATSFDSVALENICAGYLGGVVTMPQEENVDDQLKKIMLTMGWEKALTLWSEVFPNVDITVGTDSAAVTE